MTKEEANKRTFPALNLYHTHADKMAWMPLGKLWKAPGDWAMMTGHFSEPSIGSVIRPGKDWVVLRTRLGMFRRQHSQAMVPLSQDYPRGLTFHAGESYLIDEFVIFRGVDVQSPEKVTGIQTREDESIVVSYLVDHPKFSAVVVQHYRIFDRSAKPLDSSMSVQTKVKLYPREDKIEEVGFGLSTSMIRKGDGTERLSAGSHEATAVLTRADMTEELGFDFYLRQKDTLKRFSRTI